MFEIMTREITACDLKEVVAKLIPDSIGKEVDKDVAKIFPLQNVCIHKVKILKSPKFDLQKLLDLHTEGLSSDSGARVDTADAVWSEPLPAESV
jgi:small subunit ribosomal protein S3Ae